MVADFDGTYYAILGRPSLTKFMAVPHYSYLVLKMPTEKGVLTIRGNVYTAYTCEEESFKITEAIDLSIRMAETAAQAAQIYTTYFERRRIPSLPWYGSRNTTKEISKRIIQGIFEFYLKIFKNSRAIADQE